MIALLPFNYLAGYWSFKSFRRACLLIKWCRLGCLGRDGRFLPIEEASRAEKHFMIDASSFISVSLIKMTFDHLEENWTIHMSTHVSSNYVSLQNSFSCLCSIHWALKLWVGIVQIYGSIVDKSIYYIRAKKWIWDSNFSARSRKMKSKKPTSIRY